MTLDAIHLLDTSSTSWLNEENIFGGNQEVLILAVECLEITN